MSGFDRAARRRSLWALLVVLVLLLLGLVIWLAGRYESSLVQSRLERNAVEIVTDIRSGLLRNTHTLRALHAADNAPDAWRLSAQALLRDHREILRVEWRNAGLQPVDYVETPYRRSAFEHIDRNSLLGDLSLNCSAARRLNSEFYATSYFAPQFDGLGLEVMEMCLPVIDAGRLTGYTVATYSLQGILGELVGQQLVRGLVLSFTEADGTRLASQGTAARGNRVFVARQLLDLPGGTLVVRMENRLGTPDLFPNVLTALVATMSLALLAVLFLLARDMRRRLKAEHDLAEALAFRKAMENSLLTGLRARDLQGRITYVNPAFCKMVGLQASELLDQRSPSPYWPPELAEAYRQREEARLATGQSPRTSHESVFMRQDGTRFPVLIIEAPLINALGKHTGWMSAILDVSEQRRVEELSRASQERLQASARLAMVGEMASLLSHELNQPLAAISSYATGSLNLIRGEMQLGSPSARQTGATPQAAAGFAAAAPDAALPAGAAGAAGAASAPVAGPAAAAAMVPLFEDLQLAMRRIAEQAERAGKVIKSVHDFVRRRERVREAVEPQSLLDAIMPLVILQSRKVGVRVRIEVAPDCPPVLCDRTMVEQVLLNLSRNGMQAMQSLPGLPGTSPAPGPDHKVLTLRIRPTARGNNSAKRWVEFAVIDRGEGISAEAARQLFTPFFTTREEGMGLGLSLCRTVIEQHGGGLSFEPVMPQGTVFIFTLPAALRPAADCARAAQTVQHSHASSDNHASADSLGNPDSAAEP